MNPIVFPSAVAWALGLMIFASTLAPSNILAGKVHRELADPDGKCPALEADGYIVGIEKYKLQKKDRDSYQDHFQPLPSGNGSAPESVRARNKIFGNRLNDEKTLVISHLAAFQKGRIRFLHNEYGKSSKPEFEYQRSLNALESLRSDLRRRLKENSYSHALVMAMGWNNDQKESIRRFNRINANLRFAAGDSAEFKPLVVGVTWPSVWFGGSKILPAKKLGHVTSYGNKAHDADEVGYTWANMIVNQLLPAELPAKTKIVLIGHSFGARLLSRAVFSRDHLKAGAHERFPDLFVGLQGAFSANRFIPLAGREGHPYSEFSAVKTPIVLTTSTNDLANPIAAFTTRAKHVGGRFGRKTAAKHPKVFQIFGWNPNTQTLPEYDRRVVLIDAGAIVNNDKLSAHNDILDAEMGLLLWRLISRFAPPPRVKPSPVP